MKITPEYIAESIEIIFEAIVLDPVAMGKLVAILSDESFTAVQKIPYMQLKRYIDGVRRIEDELGNACKLSDRLFSDTRKRNENAMRVYKMVIASDTEKKIDYLVDATRSMLCGLIDVEMMFRMFRAIAESMPEDLSYLSSLIEKSGPFKGDLRIHALARSGLMISAGIDSDEDIEKQMYDISTLGYLVDHFVLSINNDDRQNWYKKKSSNGNRLFNGPQTVSNEELIARVGQLFDDCKPELMGEVSPNWQEL